ncbi:unnamed protein product [Strongylus vulgaris]|uniref:Carboxypeptidase n=1 Tax=Strongylus vulgaris TaxID=40348 RepID=A0A3P7JPE4_STRVU|nr:unnamed protein product [Strongylus vulgaris]
MTPVFQSIIDSGYSLASFFTVRSERFAWNYTRTTFLPQLGGYVKSWSYKQTSLDLLTVKGAGHFVPTDRPGPALQMIYNFIYTGNYNSSIPYSLNPQAVLPQFTSPPQPSFTRKQADRVWTLPGVTYELNFKQYSGYLNGVPGNYLHYW